MKYFLALPAALLLLQSSCGKPSAPSSELADASKASQLPTGWNTYEDDWFRISYPEGSDVGGAQNGKQNPKFPTLAAIPKSAEPGGGFGAFTLQFDVKTNGMLLRDALQSQIAHHTKPRGALLVPPREVKVGNGKCMSAVASWPFDNCPNGQGSCFSASILTVCDDFAGRRYTANSLLSRGKNPQQLSPQAQQEAAVYERILRSLEFKKS